MYKIIFAVLVLTMMFGCATRKTMTREEYLSTTQRTYANKTQTDVLNAAERVFILSDGDDYQFHHTDNTLSASRRWLVYLVFGAAMGTDYWTVQSTDVKGGTKASVLLSTSAGSVLGTAFNNTPGVVTSPAMGDFATGPAVYDLFWNRMDFILGKSDKWMTCEDLGQLIEKKITWGNAEALCNSFNVKDNLPENVKKTQSKDK